MSKPERDHAFEEALRETEDTRLMEHAEQEMEKEIKKFFQTLTLPPPAFHDGSLFIATGQLEVHKVTINRSKLVIHGALVWMRVGQLFTTRITEDGKPPMGFSERYRTPILHEITVNLEINEDPDREWAHTDYSYPSENVVELLRVAIRAGCLNKFPDICHAKKLDVE